MRFVLIALMLAGCTTMTPEKLSVISDSALCDYIHDKSQDLRKPRTKRLYTSDSQLIERIEAGKAEVESRGLDCSKYAVSDDVNCTSKTNPWTGVTSTNCG